MGASYASMPGAAGSLAGFAAGGRPARQLRRVGSSVDNVLPDIAGLPSKKLALDDA